VKRSLLAITFAIAAGVIWWRVARTSPEGNMDKTDTVELIARLSSDSAKSQRWSLTYAGTSGRDATFDLDLGPRRPASSRDFSFAHGVLHGGGGSAPDAFLKALAEALEAGAPWPGRAAAVEMPLDVGILGDSLARGALDQKGRVIAGEFTDARPGSWLVAKLFLKDGEAEVFLALSATERLGLLIKKDPEYGPDVVAEFARLFR
jgi:hypothetical protein